MYCLRCRYDSHYYLLNSLRQLAEFAITPVIYDDIKNFNQEFSWEPRMVNEAVLERLRRSKKSESRRQWPSGFIVAGVGGSHYAAILLQAWRSELKLTTWANYGLPPLSAKELKEHIIIIGSYSGNTEEAIDSFKLAWKKKLPLVVMASGGKLIKLAQKFKLPYVLIPAGIQPRAALGYLVKALLIIMHEKQALRDVSGLAKTFRPNRYEKEGKAFTRKLKGSIPILYSSPRNFPIIWNWKVRFDETGKIPAFCNAIPEMNHSEMIGFDPASRAAPLSKRFYFLFLEDEFDHPRIRKRMNITRNLFAKYGFRTDAIPLQGKNFWEKMFSSIILADWTAYYIAKHYHAEPEAIPMIEEFKKLIASR